MSNLVIAIYYGGLLVLFFFWIYGIVSFVLDVRYKIVPGIRRYRRGRRRLEDDATERDERDERERQLY
ncbi:hypothetical protein ACFQO4_12900 [Saliphagus sp. GCM10025334]|uniref:hypothetical protein n=1 Tax=Natronosalvus halobius TaxID=2953746 RepID=UPI00209CFD2D|nr:hypothetical protein [Natronosalvus halobius]USZ72946.1 hypothetical protein NGM15_06485 [Natronosalvus halobius]